MFIELANAMGGTSTVADVILTQQRPLQVLDFLEGYWQGSALALPVPADPALARPGALDAPGLALPVIFPPVHHIAYALCLENTRLMDIMRRVILEYRSGERLPPATPPTQRWLQVTEEVFFGGAPYSVRSLSSLIRPDAGAIRRNAYYRLLGMDLNHGTEDGRPYPYIKADIANRDFSVVFEALLREVWKGYANRNNWINTNTTDPNAINELVRRLREMMNARRLDGSLAREEFDAVATLSWFFLAVAYDTRIVRDLNAQAVGAADRLRLIGERVGVPAHARTDSYFQLAAPLSVILRAIEQDGIAAAGGAQSLYAGIYQDAMTQIITHWAIATGRDLKDVAAPQTTGAVLQATAPGAVAAASARNGGTTSRIAPALR
jgi:hypothetical protein